jgi:hypothetical protein
MVRWNELSRDEQETIRRIMQGRRSGLPVRSVARLKELGLAEPKPGGFELNERGKQLYRTAHARRYL